MVLLRLTFIVSVTVFLVMGIAGCAKNELPTPTNPKYIGIQPVDEDQNGVIDEKDVKALEEKADNWFNVCVLPFYIKAGIELKTEKDINTEENTNILKNNLTVSEWEKLIDGINDLYKIRIQQEATKMRVDNELISFDSGKVGGNALAPDRLDFWFEDGRLAELTGISIPTPTSKYRKMSIDMFYKLALNKVAKIEYDTEKHEWTNQFLYVYIYIGDMFINAEMVSRGYARAKQTPKNSRYDALFMKLEKEAKEKKRGIWAFTNEF